MDYLALIEDEESDILSPFPLRSGPFLGDSDFLAPCSHTILLLKGMSSEHGK